MQRGTKTLLLCIALTAQAAACGKSASDSTDAVDAPEGTSSAGGKPTPSSASVQAAQQGAQAGSDAGNADGPVAGSGSHSMFFAEEGVGRLALGIGSVVGATKVGGCAAQLAGDSNATAESYAVNANLTFDAGSCSGKIKLSGTESVQATWSGDANATSRTLNVTDALVRTLANDDTVAISTLDPNVGWTYQITSSGVPADGTVNMMVTLNEHRVRTAADGNVVFEHAITTDANAAVHVQSAYTTTNGQVQATSRTLTSGTIVVHHLLAKFVASHAMSNVTYDLTGDCACPTAGSMVQTVVEDNGSGGYTRAYTFTGCGTATVDTTNSTLAGTANGSATVTMNDCTM